MQGARSTSGRIYLGTLQTVESLPFVPRKILTPEFAFDVFHEAYKQAHSRVHEQTIRALDPTDYHDHLWRPDRRARPRDYLADFANAGINAIEKLGRRKMFELYYVALMPYDLARKELEISELGWVMWNDEIKRTVGKACLEKQLFPPRQYFGN